MRFYKIALTSPAFLVYSSQQLPLKEDTVQCFYKQRRVREINIGVEKNMKFLAIS